MARTSKQQQHQSTDRPLSLSVAQCSSAMDEPPEQRQLPCRSPQYDVIILGASGFTGKYVVREALKFLAPTAPSSPLKSIALAGRNPARLADALRWAARPDLPPDIALLAADAGDPASLGHMCAQTRLVLNCVGPFRLYGEPIVAACVESGWVDCFIDSLSFSSSLGFFVRYLNLWRGMEKIEEMLLIRLRLMEASPIKSSLYWQLAKSARGVCYDA